MNINSRTNITFKAHIQFCTKQELNKRAKDKGVKFNDCDDFIYGENIGTQGVYMCNAGGIKSIKSKKNLVFHIYDGCFFDDLKNNLNDLNNKFLDARYKHLKEGLDKTQALIFGADFKYETSKDFAIIIDYLCKNHNIDYSSFVGADEKKAMLYDSAKDTWFVNLQREYRDNKDKPQVKNIFEKNSILKAFNYIKMSPNDTVNFKKNPQEGENFKNLQKGKLNSSKENVIKILEKYKVDPKILDKLDYNLSNKLDETA